MKVIISVKLKLFPLPVEKLNFLEIKFDINYEFYRINLINKEIINTRLPYR